MYSHSNVQAYLAKECPSEEQVDLFGWTTPEKVANAVVRAIHYDSCLFSAQSLAYDCLGCWSVSVYPTSWRCESENLVSIVAFALQKTNGHLILLVA